MQAIRTVHKGGSLLQPVIASKLFERGEARRSAALTEREFEVLRALASGAQDKQIAAGLFLSTRTVKFHLRNIYSKLDVHNRTQAVRAATEQGLLDLAHRTEPPA